MNLSKIKNEHEINIIPNQIEIQQLNGMNELHQIEEMNRIKEDVQVHVVQPMEETPMETVQNETENIITDIHQLQTDEKQNEITPPPVESMQTMQWRSSSS